MKTVAVFALLGLAAVLSVPVVQDVEEEKIYGADALFEGFAAMKAKAQSAYDTAKSQSDADAAKLAELSGAVSARGAELEGKITAAKVAEDLMNAANAKLASIQGKLAAEKKAHETVSAQAASQDTMVAQSESDASAAADALAKAQAEATAASSALEAAQSATAAAKDAHDAAVAAHSTHAATAALSKGRADQAQTDLNDTFSYANGEHTKLCNSNVASDHCVCSGVCEVKSETCGTFSQGACPSGWKDSGETESCGFAKKAKKCCELCKPAL